MGIIQIIKKKIASSINLIDLKIIDKSSEHIGHKFISTAPISHIKLIIISNDFLNIKKLERHKLLYNILASEIQLIHSVSLSAYTEEEYTKLKKKINPKL
ncbi:BolA family transcriptional regulator [Neoehrlichia mikurensis]|uniref:BolA family transcriptional regulator n=1 Tax=Neoehrlichia mikurensis TaxID=89586 RepID=A0A9Q9F4H7_9RICK|nr:BolA family protein [Neoehrlichia mikurensis]QXK92150.1 BolA family transcriptional regulator [Neoehrlichia mikurensis]QXK92607.1 BolA family transcriptional regulator [Neoehrlichia mikurensis]QXK93844.1 BolA family transcriptional regulator [Neoehrlichia mikurensis]UTO55161.1 BolA family transcriptional regulator [Neoehrlichia mikurensis]UTO56081.1 BolA family transcriptional regulator [Neoehrlichia mikurensis]